MKKIVVMLMIFLLITSLFAEKTDVKAFKNIYFGESQKVVKDKLKDVENMEKVEQYMDFVIDSEYKILHYKYTVWSYFLDKQLYKIWFYGSSYSNMKYNWSTKDEIKLLKEIFVKSYGEPDKTRHLSFQQMIKIHELKNEWLYVWNVNDKEIKIGLQLNGNSHNVQILLTYKPLNQIKLNQKKEKRQQVINQLSKDF